MSDSPRRFKAGGFVSPHAYPLRLVPRGTEELSSSAKAKAAACYAEVDGLGAEGRALLQKVAEEAAFEVAARIVTLELIRRFGVTKPAQALRAAPQPLPRMEARVLEKLEAVAQHLGTP